MKKLLYISDSIVVWKLVFTLIVIIFLNKIFFKLEIVNMIFSSLHELHEISFTAEGPVELPILAD